MSGVPLNAVTDPCLFLGELSELLEPNIVSWCHAVTQWWPDQGMTTQLQDNKNHLNLSMDL